MTMMDKRIETLSTDFEILGEDEKSYILGVARGLALAAGQEGTSPGSDPNGAVTIKSISLPLGERL
jgi:hypothetical protein